MLKVEVDGTNRKLIIKPEIDVGWSEVAILENYWQNSLWVEMKLQSNVSDYKNERTIHRTSFIHKVPSSKMGAARTTSTHVIMK